MRKISGLFGALILAIGVTFCGGGGDATGTPPPPPPPPPPTCPAKTFCMGAASFVTAAATTQPVALTVGANAAVTWTNDSGGTPHDVTFDAPATALAVGAGNGGDIPQPATGSNQRQFAVSGSSHPFHCTIHGTATTGMRGVVVVQ